MNKIRPRVKAWREAGYPGVTGTTKRLLAHWRDPEERENRRFFFCQLEAIETLIWLSEAPAADTQGISVPGDGGPFQRLCSKMATGSGKTIVMAMLIAWQILNKVANPQDKRFSKNVFVVAPGLTVRSRLSVLEVDRPGNYYDEFNIVPGGLREQLRQGLVLVRNWHRLNWESDEQIAKKRSVDKRGAKSDEAYVRDVLGEMARSRNIVVINDEAHHAWRLPAGSKVAGVSKADIDEATKWVGGLDRIHRARGILCCYDLSATPFAQMSAVLEGKPDLTRWSEIDLAELAHKFRPQKITFEAARDVYDQMQPTWKGSREWLLAQLVRLVEQFLASDRIRLLPELFSQDTLRRRVLLTLNMNRIVQHLWEAIRFQNTEVLEPVFDAQLPIRSTGDMPTWYTGKPCHPTIRSHVNQCVFDGTWEASEAYVLDHGDDVAAWVKNGHCRPEFARFLHKFG